MLQLPCHGNVNDFRYSWGGMVAIVVSLIFSGGIRSLLDDLFDLEGKQEKYDKLEKRNEELEKENRLLDRENHILKINFLNHVNNGQFYRVPN